jgi:hypothetical protein
MGFGFNMDLKDVSHSLNAGNVLRLGSVFWKKMSTPIFFIFFIGMLSFGGYIWNINLSGKGWSEEKKQEYINNHSKGVVFNENDFKKVIENVETKKNADTSLQQPLRDIFKKY